MKSFDHAGWLNKAKHFPSPNFNQRPENIEVNLLVIHSISLPPDKFGAPDVIDFFLNQLDFAKHPFYAELKDVKVSAHFLIERSGEMNQFVSIFDRAWHAGVSSHQGQQTCNDYSVGIELEGCDSLPFTAAQYQSLVQLTDLLMHVFPALTKERIVSHAEIALPAGRKTDPGPHFDWDLYLQEIE